MKKQAGRIIYSPSDLVRFLASPFASWMDHYLIENPGAMTPDDEAAGAKLVMQTGIEHERAVLAEYRASVARLVEIPTANPARAHTETLAAIAGKAPIIYQAALEAERFAGFADFLSLTPSGAYQVWDTKLARAPKPYYVIQLCC